MEVKLLKHNSKTVQLLELHVAALFFRIDSKWVIYVVV